jgi:hypothetical protein
MIRRTLSASWPLLKNEKKYCHCQRTHLDDWVDVYLINSKCLAIVNDTHFDCVGHAQYGTLFDLDNVLYRERDLDAIALVVCAEYDFLDGSDPLLRTCCAVCLELVRSFVRFDDERRLLLALLLALESFSRYSILKVDAIPGKVQLCRIGIVRQNIST